MCLSLPFTSDFHLIDNTCYVDLYHRLPMIMNNTVSLEGFVLFHRHNLSRLIICVSSLSGLPHVL